MRVGTRKLLDRAFSGLGLTSIVLLAASLLIILAPMAIRGAGAFVFRGTIEWRQLMFEKFGRGNPDALEAQQEEVRLARKPVYDMLAQFETEMTSSLDGLLPKLELLAQREDSLARLVARRMKRLEENDTFESRLNIFTSLHEKLAARPEAEEIKTTLEAMGDLLPHLEKRKEGLEGVETSMTSTPM